MKCLKGQPGLFLCKVLPIYNNLLSAITESSESITEMCLHGKQQLLGRFSTPSMSCKESLLLIRQLKQLSSLTSSLSYRVTMRMLESLARESAEQDSISPWRTRKVTRGERREAMKSKVSMVDLMIIKKKIKNDGMQFFRTWRGKRIHLQVFYSVVKWQRKKMNSWEENKNNMRKMAISAAAATARLWLGEKKTARVVYGSTPR